MILLIEDHASLRRVLTRSLTALGYEVRVAATADEALSLLEEGLLPQLVIADIHMPGRYNGLDVVRWVRTNRPKIPVQLQTGFVEEGAADFPIPSKPYSIEYLIRSRRRTSISQK